MASHTSYQQEFAVVVAAAGVGKRMQSNVPKQYLSLSGKTVLEHTIEQLLEHPFINKVVVAVSPDDEYFSDLTISSSPSVIRVWGGEERIHSVLSGLDYLSTYHAQEYPWVLVHDAARPCIIHDDITLLIEQCLQEKTGGILATPVRDTMKLANTSELQSARIEKTIDRRKLWHALTPQMFPLDLLRQALLKGLEQGEPITDEASAMEIYGEQPLLVQGRSDNIKITQPEDLALAEFYLTVRNS